MKKILALGAVLLSQTAFAATDTFEIDPAGCIFDDGEARCLVMNRAEVAVKCTLSITASTQKKLRLGNSKEVIIYPRMYEVVKVFAAPGDKIVSSTASSSCSYIKSP